MIVCFNHRLGHQDLIKKFTECPFCKNRIMTSHYLEAQRIHFYCNPCLFSVEALADGYEQYKFVITFTINHDMFVELSEDGVFFRDFSNCGKLGFESIEGKTKKIADTIAWVDVEWAKKKFVDKYLVLK